MRPVCSVWICLGSETITLENCHQSECPGGERCSCWSPGGFAVPRAPVSFGCLGHPPSAALCVLSAPGCLFPRWPSGCSYCRARLPCRGLRSSTRRSLPSSPPSSLSSTPSDFATVMPSGYLFPVPPPILSLRLGHGVIRRALARELCPELGVSSGYDEDSPSQVHGFW